MSIPLTFRPRQVGLPADEGSWHDDSRAFELRALTAPADISAALRLRYRAYTAMGYDIQSQNGEYTDKFDQLRSTVFFGAFDNERLVGDVRLCFSQPWHELSTLPCGAYYPALKTLKARAAGGFVEISRLSIDPEITNTSYRTTLYGFMVRAAFTAARAAGASLILVATRPDWVRFYQYMLGFRQIDEPAFYPPGDFKVTLLGGSLDAATARGKIRNRFFAITDEEVAGMREAIAPALERDVFADEEERIAV